MRRIVFVLFVVSFIFLYATHAVHAEKGNLESELYSVLIEAGWDEKKAKDQAQQYAYAKSRNLLVNAVDTFERPPCGVQWITDRPVSFFVDRNDKQEVAAFKNRMKMCRGVYSAFQKHFPKASKHIDQYNHDKYLEFEKIIDGYLQEGNVEQATNALLIAEYQAVGSLVSDLSNTRKKIEKMAKENARITSNNKKKGFKAEVFGFSESSTPEEVRQFLKEAHGFGVLVSERNGMGVLNHVYPEGYKAHSYLKAICGESHSDPDIKEKFGRRTPSCYELEHKLEAKHAAKGNYYISSNCFSKENEKLLSISFTFRDDVDTDVIVEKLSNKFGTSVIQWTANGNGKAYRWAVSNGDIIFFDKTVAVLFMENANNTLSAILSKPEPKRPGSDIEF